MSELSNYDVADLERVVVEQLHTYLQTGRRSPRAQAAVDKAADALWELRTRHRLVDGRVDINGSGPAYRAIASRIYSTVTMANLTSTDGNAYQQISTAMQRRMPARREAWIKEQLS
jgi:hypothetical protein